MAQNQGAGRRCAVRPTPPYLPGDDAQPVLVVVDHQDAQPRDIGQAGLRRTQCDLQVVQCLLDLFPEAGGEMTIGILTALPGDMDHPGGKAHHRHVRVAVGRGVVKPRRI